MIHHDDPAQVIYTRVRVPLTGTVQTVPLSDADIRYLQKAQSDKANNKTGDRHHGQRKDATGRL